MRKLLLVWLCLLGLAGFASASDIAQAQSFRATPVWTWTGFYLGGNVGYANSYNDATIVGSNPVSALVVATGIVPSTLATRANGWTGGIQGGYNWQFGSQIVAGAEVDFNWTGLEGSDTTHSLTGVPAGIPVALNVTGSRGSDWLATFRGRLGYTVFGPDTLLYATGGLALGEVHGVTTATLTIPPGTFVAKDSYSTTKWGWTAGLGYEQAIWNNLTLKIEYLYVDLGDRNGTMAVNVLGAPIAFGTHQEFTEHLIRVGANWKF